MILTNYAVPVPCDPRPGRFVQHLDFNHFRTIGMRRSVEEGLSSRFVTGDRVQAVIKVSVTRDVCFPHSDKHKYRKCPILLHLEPPSIWMEL